MSADPVEWPWSVLGLDRAPDDLRAVKRAYAKRLKSMDPEQDVQGFAELRDAFGAAKFMLAEDQGQHMAHGRIAQTIAKTQAPATQAPATHPPPIDITAPMPKAAEPEPEKDFQADVPAQQDDQPAPTPSPWAPPDLSDPMVVLAKARDLISIGNRLASDWDPLLKSDALTDPQTARQFEWELVEFLIPQAVQISNAWAVTQALCIAIDARFGWVSDGVGFLRRFPQARVLQSKMSQVLRQAGHQQPGQRNWSAKPMSQTSPVGKPVPTLALGLLVVVSILWVALG